MSFFQMTSPAAARRMFLGRSGLVLSGAAVALLAGQDPRLVLIVNNETITPEPTESSPLDFRVRACVRFQAVVAGGPGKK